MLVRNRAYLLSACFKTNSYFINAMLSCTTKLDPVNSYMELVINK